jgi:glycosyltransferase involved in cell wall biosynthesis
MPKASIVIPAYNASPFIQDTLNSVLNQTYTDFECIVVDDGSTDNTLDIVRGFSDSRIFLIQQTNSGGPAKPRNAGLARAKGEYIFLFDADDIMCPTKIQDSVAALDVHTNADILFTNYSAIDTDGKIINSNYLESYQSLWVLMPKKMETSKSIFLDSKTVYEALIRVNFIGTSSVVLRKNALKAHDIFNEDLKNSDDRLFWTLFTKHHNAVYLNSKLHQYRVQKNGISAQNFARRSESKFKVLEILFNDCKNSKLKKLIIHQIASDYLTLAFELQQNREFRLQVFFSLKSLKSKPSLKGIKLLVFGIIFFVLHLHK